VQIVCNRKGLAEPIVIDHPFVSVTGGIQPDSLGDVSDGSKEDGWTARILFSYPDPIPPAPWSEATVDGTAEYLALCHWLWNLPPPNRPIVFSPEAKARWTEWVNAHRAGQRSGHHQRLQGADRHRCRRPEATGYGAEAGEGLRPASPGTLRPRHAIPCRL
jgi:hypothetical protein